MIKGKPLDLITPPLFVKLNASIHNYIHGKENTVSLTNKNSLRVIPPPTRATNAQIEKEVNFICITLIAKVDSNLGWISHLKPNFLRFKLIVSSINGSF